MAAITLEVAKKHLEMWLEAESEVAINQSYTKTRLSHVQRSMKSAYF